MQLIPTILCGGADSILAPSLANCIPSRLSVSLQGLERARVEVKGVLFNGQLQRVASTYGYGYKYGNYKQAGAIEP